LGNAGLLGVHTIVVFDEDGNTVWPQEEREYRPKPQRRWSPDRALEATPQPTKFDFKEYEFKLLAAFAQCYRGQITLKQLPMIPTQMAELILRYGGLTEWINFDESPQEVLEDGQRAS
jgi:hypothetical protein